MKNKKILSLALVFTLAAAVMFASPLGVGVTAGGTLSFVDSNVPGDKTPRYGVTGGIFGTFSLIEIENTMDLSVRPEVLFVMKGYKDSNDNKVNFNTIEVPILVKTSILSGLSAAPYVMVGPTVGILLSADYDKISIDGNIKPFDIGVVFGAGVETENGLGLDVRFNLGVSNIIDSDYLHMKNRTISIMTSYSLL